jgi:hypothetical protein
MKQKFKELKANDRVKTLHSGMATVVSYNGGTMVKLDCDVKKWNCPYFYEHELDFGDQDVDEQDVQQETLEEAAENYNSQFTQQNKFAIEDFINGAKWQQERMFDIMQQFASFCVKCDREKLPLLFAKEWFEQFKNK